MEAIPLCSSCIGTTGQSANKAVDDNYKCALCFGILSDVNFRKELAHEVGTQFESSGYDGNSIIVAVNLPISMLLRELLFAELLGDAYNPREMSPKSLFSNLLQNDIERVSHLDAFKLLLGH
jgi:hypothetical protein